MARRVAPKRKIPENNISAQVRAMAKAEAAKAPRADLLKRAREMVKEARDLEVRMQNGAELMKQLGTRKNELTFKELPDLYSEAGIRNLGIEADGNLPAYDTQLKPFYKANMPEDPDLRSRGFQWLDKEGHGDLIKVQFTINLGRGDVGQAKKLEAALKKLKIEYEKKMTVPWNTLTAFVKEQIEEKHRTPPLDLLGAVVGQVVTIKPVKEKN
mgnify:CR=1 FL=1